MIESVKRLQLLRLGDCVKLTIPREHEIYGGQIVKIFPANLPKSIEEVETYFGPMLRGHNLAPLCEPVGVDYLVLCYGDDKFYCFPRNPLMVISHGVTVQRGDHLQYKLIQVVPKGTAALSDLGVEL